VCASFEQVLGRSQVGLYDNFFDLGGHSLLAVRLFDRLHALSSVRLPLATLFQAATPYDLAALIRAQASRPTPAKGARITRLCAGEAPPELLFLVRAGEAEEADLANYGSLARRLERSSVALTFELDADLTLSQLAAHCLTQARELGLAGVVTLVGRGVAGNLAQELAVQLEEAGETVGRVVLLDSLAQVTFAAPTRAYLKAAPRHALRALATVASLPPNRRLPHLRRQAARLGMYLAHVLDSDLPGFLPDPRAHFDPQTLPRAYRELVPSEWQALGLHDARACRAPIFLLRGRRRGLLPRASDSGWGELTRAKVNTIVVEHRLAEELSTALLAALQGLPS
jgi:thioesterase domain-containing protein